MYSHEQHSCKDRASGLLTLLSIQQRETAYQVSLIVPLVLGIRLPVKGSQISRVVVLSNQAFVLVEAPPGFLPARATNNTNYPVTVHPSRRAAFTHTTSGRLVHDLVLFDLDKAMMDLFFDNPIPVLGRSRIGTSVG